MRHRRAPLRLVGVLVGAALLQSCGPANATLSLEPCVTGTELVVAGSTDLPDGTLVSVVVSRQFQDFVRDDVPVVDGRYERRLSLAVIPPGDLSVKATVEPGAHQPDATTARIGITGESLSGPQLDIGQGYPRLLVYTTVAVPAQSPGAAASAARTHTDLCRVGIGE